MGNNRIKTVLVCVSLLLAVALVSAIVVISINSKKTGDNSSDSSVNTSGGEALDDVITVTLQSHEELFKVSQASQGENIVEENESRVSLAINYIDEKGYAYQKTYDLNDRELKNIFMKYDVTITEYSEAGYQPEGVVLSFETGKIDSNYKVIVPEEFKGNKVCGVKIESERPDDKLVEIECPDSCNTIWVENLYSAKRVTYGTDARYINLNNCPNLVDISSVSNDNYFSIGSTFSRVGIYSYSVPESVLVIRNSFLELDNFAEVSLDKNLKLIKDSFNNCPLLKEVDIPDDIVYISNSFNNCPNLILVVGEDTYGETYAKDNDIKFKYRD